MKTRNNQTFAQRVAMTLVAMLCCLMSASAQQTFTVYETETTTNADIPLTGFTTDCDVTSFPWTEDFNGYTAAGDFNHPCWLNEQIGGGSAIFEITTSSLGNKTPQLYLPSYLSGTVTMLRLPAMTLPSSNFQFSLDICRSGSCTSDTGEGVRVFASADGSIDGATELAFIPRDFFRSSDEIPSETKDGWYSYDLPIPMDGSCYIILRSESSHCAPIFLDNFMVTEVSCPKPTSPKATGISATSVTLSWNPGGSENSWVVYMKPKNSDDDYTETVVNDAPTYTLTDLTPETTYNWYVKAVCSSDNYSSPTLVRSFDATEKQTIGFDASFNRSLPLSSWYDYSRSQQIYTVSELGEAGLIESVDFYLRSNNSFTRNLDVYMVGTDKSSFVNKSDWISVSEDNLVFSGEVTFAGYSWNAIELTYPFVYDGKQNVALVVVFDGERDDYGDETPFLSYPTEENQAICAYGTSHSASNTFLVNSKNQIRILKSTLGGCKKPTGLKTLDVGPAFAVLSWHENGSAEQWTVAYKSQGESNFTEITVTENPYELACLSTETEYTVKVKPVCDELWSREISFTTLEACPDVVNLAVDISMPATATVSWKGYGDSYQLWLGSAKDETNTDYVFGRPIEVTDEEYTFEGLTPGVRYAVLVLTKVDGIDWLSLGVMQPFTMPYFVTLKHTGEGNQDAIVEYNDKPCRVTLDGFTFSKDGSWSTIVLPFDVTLADSPLADAEARPLSSAPLSSDILNLMFGNSVDVLEAGRPYLIKWNNAQGVIEDPVFTEVTMKNIHNDYDNGVDKGNQRLRFIGVYEPKPIPVGDKTFLFMDGVANVDACHAYFKLGDDDVHVVLPVEGKYFKGWNMEMDGTGKYVTAIAELSLWNGYIPLYAQRGDLVMGDVNGDGHVTPADAIMILYHYFGVRQSGFIMEAADLNGDLSISPADAIEALYLYFSSSGARAGRPAPSDTKSPE